MQKSSKLVLDELKSVRSTSVALTTRVRKFKSELEDILSDDQDMFDPHGGCAPARWINVR